MLGQDAASRASRLAERPKLYRANSLANFWQPAVDVPPAAWDAAAAAAAPILPGGSAILEQSGLDGLTEYILGEGLFGYGRQPLTRSMRLYYQLKTFLPRPLILSARRRYRAWQVRKFPLGWPIEPRYVHFLYQAMEHVAEQVTCSGQARLDSEAREVLGCRAFWPDAARFAFVLTHDVEAQAGYEAVRRLAALDERFGFRASFNFVPHGYVVEDSLLAELRARGFEVGAHGLKHDARLFWSEAHFAWRVKPINAYLRRWDAVGFRAPYVHRQAHLMQALEVEYDSSFFDTDPYEPMPGGTMSIWPFLCGSFVELPYTLAQDHTLLAVLGERTPRLWLDKVDFIANWGGMALLNVHPDYMLDPRNLAVYEAFLAHMAERRSDWRPSSERPATSGSNSYWHALPREVARWWRARLRTTHEMGGRREQTL